MTMSGGGTYSKRKRNILLPSSSNASSHVQKKIPPSARPDEKLKYSPAIIRWLSERDAVTAQVNNSDPGNLSTQNSTRLPDPDMTGTSKDIRIENGKRKGEYNGNQRRRATIENGIQIDVPVVDTMTNTTGFQQEHKANVSKPDSSYNDQNKLVKRAVSIEHLTSVGHSGIKPATGGLMKSGCVRYHLQGKDIRN